MTEKREQNHGRPASNHPHYVVAEYLAEAESIDSAPRLITSGIGDSFSMVALKLFFERTYRVEIPDDEGTPEAFDTVDRIAELVARLRARGVARR